MPCESCNAQFTVFKRKRTCVECKRFYCSNCLTKHSAHITLCERCSIFTKRPLLKVDLLQLKPKDLIFYLQSKHISTTGCVEKDELIELVLNHVQQNDVRYPINDANSPSNSSRSDADQANSFESLKQTCQNFFSNITENISDSFASFEGKSTSKTRAHSQDPNVIENDSTHIFTQPRVSTREIPSYASSQNYYRVQSPPLSPSGGSGVQKSADIPTGLTENTSTTNDGSGSPAESRSTSHPIMNDSFNEIKALTKSDCDCSEDELIAAFNEISSKKQRKCTRISSERKENPADRNKSQSDSLRQKPLEKEESSQSSFEELGAIGGISDDSKTATDTNSSYMEQWHILETQQEDIGGQQLDNNVGLRDHQVALILPTHLDSMGEEPTSMSRPKKVSRRRSDGFLNRRPTSSDDEGGLPLNKSADSQTIGCVNLHEQHELSDPIKKRKECVNCKRCGKSKTNIKRHVQKLRRHLENIDMSEADIKDELKEFLIYLENRTKLIERSDSETGTSSNSVPNCSQITTESISANYLNDNGDEDDGDVDDDDDYENETGIPTYSKSMNFSHARSRFISLDNFKSIKELDNLSVKQLKEVLMLNRVDYKGCCEKHELLDRVKRLWHNKKSTPAIDKLQTDELCKICMDAPIECVILECGHMATCTNCGKVLSECPICRQYIVRVVRFFRA